MPLDEPSGAGAVARKPPATKKAPAQCLTKRPGQVHGSQELACARHQLLGLIPRHIPGDVHLSLLRQLMESLQLGWGHHPSLDLQEGRPPLLRWVEGGPGLPWGCLAPWTPTLGWGGWQHLLYPLTQRSRSRRPPGPASLGGLTCPACSHILSTPGWCWGGSPYPWCTHWANWVHHPGDEPGIPPPIIPLHPAASYHLHLL